MKQYGVKRVQRENLIGAIISSIPPLTLLGQDVAGYSFITSTIDLTLLAEIKYVTMYHR